MNTNRRSFLISLAQGIGASTIGAISLKTYVEASVKSDFALRPPGALDENDFIASCIKCGLCVESCPYDTLSLARLAEDRATVGTPYFKPRDIPCYMCEDIPCVQACPTDALDEQKVSTDNNLDIDKAKMGVAIVDEKSCIAFWGVQCDACYRACPLMDKALFIKYEKNERTSKHAFLEPIVNTDVCTGCGMCEHACITEVASIKILPKDKVLGKAGDHYVKGWDKQDIKRVKKAKNKINTTKISKRSVISNLNDMDLLDE